MSSSLISFTGSEPAQFKWYSIFFCSLLFQQTKTIAILALKISIKTLPTCDVGIAADLSWNRPAQRNGITRILQMKNMHKQPAALISLLTTVSNKIICQIQVARDVISHKLFVSFQLKIQMYKYFSRISNFQPNEHWTTTERDMLLCSAPGYSTTIFANVYVKSSKQKTCTLAKIRHRQTTSPLAFHFSSYDSPFETRFVFKCTYSIQWNRR